MSQLTVGFVLVLVLGGILLIPVAERLRVPAPVLTTVFGLLLALTPGVPEIAVSPELILPVLLPPLLYAAARRSSWRQFAANVRPILVLAVLLVFITTAAIAVVAATVHPLLPVGAAVVLGAIVSPPDAAAVTTIAGRLGLPRRLVTVLEGEGLFNDVTALTLYQVAVAGVVAGAFSPWRAALEFGYGAVVAVAVGLIVGYLAKHVFDRIDDSRITTALSLLVPYIAYVPTDELHGSGVLAVLVCAFFISAKASDPDDIEGRLVRGSFWEVVELMVTAVTFGFVGLELVAVFASVGPGGASLVWKAAVVGIAVIAVRALWMLLAVWLTRRGPWWRGRPLGWRGALILAWSGMRGVVTIVAALALPYSVKASTAFPGRDQILFVATVVVVLTLLLQGLTLRWLIERVGLSADTEKEKAALRKVTKTAARAAEERLRELTESGEVSETTARRLRDWSETLLADEVEPEDEQEAEDLARRRKVRAGIRHVERELLAAARAALLDARASHGYDPLAVDEVLQAIDMRSATLGGH